MKKITVLLASVGFAAMAGTTAANAASISTLLNFGSNQMSDESYEVLANNAGGATTLDIGDSLQGILNINTINSSGANAGGSTGNHELTAVFSATVTGKTGNSTDGFVWTFSPDSNFEASFGAGAMVAMFEDGSNNFDGTTIAGGFTTASDGTPFAVFGMAGTTGEGWRAASDLSSGIITDDLADFAGYGSGTGIINFNLALSCLTSGILKCDQITADTASPFGGPGNFAQVVGSGQVRGVADLNTEFAASDNVNFAFNRIPEPATLGMFGLGLLGLGFAARRRKAA